MVAELRERLLDSAFDQDFPEGGSFIKVTSKGRGYWYYKPSLKDGVADKRIYVGPVDRPEINQRVEKFRRLKDDFRARRALVSALTRDAHLFQPEPRVGRVIETLWKAGLFRMRACLVGTVAFQTYGSLLGLRLPGQAMQTGDIDITQFQAISVAIEDSLVPMVELLRSADPGFSPVNQLDDRAGPSRFVAPGELRFEFLTPNRGSDDLTGKPIPIPALGGVTATPLRFLDYLIHQPVQAVMLHGGGIPVIVPDPARYAIHKLIVAERRKSGTGKDEKDLRQAAILCAAFRQLGRLPELGEAMAEALERGPAWRSAISASIDRMRSSTDPEQGGVFNNLV
ncbi:MAG: hypothetical protein H6890_07880 [Brucellaceae bacterium]|nr:hypothetical protein [Brucellaceae bacterium]